MKLKVLFFVLLAVLLTYFPQSAEAGVKYTFSLSEPVGSNGLNFEDENISISFLLKEKPDHHEYPFKLTNKSKSILKIDWNQVTIIGRDGSSNRIGHSGVAFIDIKQGKSLQPSILPPGSFINDSVFFAEDIEFFGSLGWINTSRLYPRTHKNALEYVGTTRKIFMPIEINGKTTYYTFSVRVDKVEQD